MSDIEVKVVRVNISGHPNADKLEIATIGSLPGEGGYESVVGLNQFQTGDLVIYIPPGSVINAEMTATLMKRSKIEIKGGRIRAINIRSVLSEGLCLKSSEWIDRPVKEGEDLTETLGVIKYEPPARSQRGGISLSGRVNWNYENRNFVKYSCVEQFKKYPQVLEVGEEVVITKKMHGTSWAAGIVKKIERKENWWQRVKSFVWGREDMEFLVRSHNKIRYLSRSAVRDGEWKNDTYWQIAQKYDIENIVKQIALNELTTNPTLTELPQVAIYGEIIGGGIQKGYGYSVPQEDLEVRVFDIMIDRKFISWDRLKHLCNCFDLPTVEQVYRGPWSLDLTKLSEAVDEYDGKKFVREGIVIKPVIDRRDHECGRVCLKYLNPTYLLDKKNSDYH